MIIILFILLTHLFLPLFLLNFATTSAKQFQDLCIQLTQEIHPQDPYLKTLLCGQMTTSSWTSGFSDLQLIHILVISGSHLAFLDSIIDWLWHFHKLQEWKFLKFILKVLTLSLLCLMSGLQPPTLFYFVRFCIQSAQLKTGKKHSKLLQDNFSGFLCLALFPTWLESISLLLSWSLHLSINLFNSMTFSFRQPKQLALLFEQPTLALLTPIPFSPIGMLTNFFLSRFLGSALITLSFLCLIFPITWSALDQIALLPNFISDHLSKNLLPQNDPSFSRPNFWSWVFLIVLALAGSAFRPRRFP